MFSKEHVKTACFFLFSVDNKVDLGLNILRKVLIKNHGQMR